MREADVSHEFCLFHGRHLVEDILSEDAVVVVSVDGEIANTEGGEILEEVCSLAWINAIVFQSRLHDKTCATNVRPLHWYAEPIVA